MDKSKKTAHIKDILNSILKENKYLSEVKILKVKKKWNDIVGEELIKHTSPLYFKKDILFVNCDYQGWINTLQFYKSDILNNIINIFSDEIKIIDIRFIFVKDNNFKQE
jgi:predicted nucleic acid-binding Zn ribbon protein